MKYFILLLTTLFVFSCTVSNDSSVIQEEQLSLIDDCPRVCNITFYPNDPEASIMPCGDLTMTFDDGYFILCLPENISIVEYLGWYPNTLDEYYNSFWSFVLRGNCVLFQPHHNFYDTVLEEGFQLDLIICDEFPQSIMDGTY